MNCAIALHFINEQETEKLFCMHVDAIFALAQKQIFSDCEQRKVCLAVSGGSDSMALLLLANQWAILNDVELFAITVDHQLRAESSDEARFVKSICDGLSISHHTLVWKHDNINFNKLESSAREARYSLLDSFCKTKKISAVFTGHTWNDQMETFCMRKSCGSNDRGMAGMSKVRTISERLSLLRPLLFFSRIHLQHFLIAQNICWKNDPMNVDIKFKRIQLRNEISKYTANQIAEISEKIIKLGEQRHRLEQKAVSFIKSHVLFHKEGYSSVDLQDVGVEDTNDVMQEIIRRIVWNIGGKKYAPNITECMLQKIMNGEINTLAKCIIKIRKKTMFIFRENRDIPRIHANNNKKFIWDNRFLINIRSELTNFVVCSSICSRTDIPKEALCGFPDFVSSDGAVRVSVGDVLFLNKACLCDVFL